MGFNATVLDRIQSGLKAELLANKSLEMMWETSGSLGASSQIFTHILDFSMYTTAPRGLEWDSFDPPVDDLNIKLLAERIVDNIKYRHSYGKTQHVLFPCLSLHCISYARIVMTSRRGQRFPALLCRRRLQQHVRTACASLSIETMLFGRDKLIAYINERSDTYGVKVLLVDPSEQF